MTSSIEFHNISKTFTERSWRSMLTGRGPKKVRALSGLSLAVRKGEVFGLLGPNGAGKTTLIKILATLIIPDSGTGTICGNSIERDALNIRRIVGLVNSSERSFYWRLTGRQNLIFFASLYDMASRDKTIRVNELLDLLGLTEKADVQFMKYSEGQKQRLAIARALLHNPEILLMDEATKSLDPIGASEIKAFALKELAGKMEKTILWCTHNLKEAEEVCSRIAIIHRGKIIAEGGFKSLRTLFEKENIYRFNLENCSLEKLAELDISPSSIIRNNGRLEFEVIVREDKIPVYINRLVGSGVHIHACTNIPLDLEEIFEKIVKNDCPTDNFNTLLLH
jgi:ABC-2 type transport system ATP-binding protein